MHEVKNKYLTAKTDRIFKAVYIDNNNDYHLLEKLLSECLDASVRIISLKYPELNIRNDKERTKRADLLIEAGNEFISLELNTSFSELTKIRNFCFFNSFYSQNTTRGNEYETKIIFMQINLSYGLSNAPLKDEVITYSKQTKKEYVNNYKIININMDKFKDLWYSKDEKAIKKYPLLISNDLDGDELKEALEISKDDNLKEVVHKMERLHMADMVYERDPDEGARLMHNTELRLAREDGLNEGISQGISQGKEQTALNMLKKDLDISLISEITGISVNDLKKLKKS